MLVATASESFAPATRVRPHVTRAAILDAARALFRDRSWDAVSMEAIASRSGFSRRTVYNQFVDCEELYRASREGLLHEVATRLPLEVDPNVAPAEALRLFCDRVAAALSDSSHVELLSSMVRDGWSNEWLLQDYQRWVRGPIMRTLEVYFHDLKARNGLTSLDVRRAALHLLAGIEAIAVTPRMVPGMTPVSDAPAEQIEDMVAAFAMRHL